MLSSLNDKKHLPAKDFDAELGALLTAEHEKRRAAQPKPKAQPKPPEKKKALSGK